jgi:hypothetical protein
VIECEAIKLADGSKDNMVVDVKALKALDPGVKIEENCKDSPRNVNTPEALVTTATKLNNAKLTIRKISRMVPQIPLGYKVQSRGFMAWLWLSEH